MSRTEDHLKITPAIQLSVGECPIYFQEPCTSNMVKFLLSLRIGDSTTINSLDPYKPQLPREYNVLVPLKIIIHGYGGLSVDIATGNVTKAYQEVGYNVIIVDWEPLASLPCYPTAFLNTWHVGQCLSILVVSLLPLGISPGFIHAIGFSLGAHVAGLAGSNLKNTLGYSFRRITGLDPALPFFATLKNEWKLDPTDANFVDVIHTNAGAFGKVEATGHVDFYVNGGSLQPHCYKARYPPLCSHAAAGLYFAESIRRNSKKFIGVECENIASYWLGWCTSGKRAVMGEFATFTTRGTYYVTTSEKPPFALDRI
ncbi:lipase member H-A-like [Anoplophora glabripennis]|uniref:lipase member H-A-like n=1 Tax=Anoplophora glabripennis TaxID=217634 RepID=UPI0008754FAE|nr:lipase member H-A-like [Anoplophora glabripennis]